MNFSFKQVVDANRDAGQAEYLDNWAIYLLYRWPGNVLAWLLLKTPLTPTQVTLSGLGVVGLMLLCALLLPLTLAPWVTLALAMLFQVLDCTDGAMARTSGRTSAVGGRLDFMVDMVQWGILYACIGILADRTLETGTLWTMFGFAAAWLRMLARIANMMANRMRDRQDKPPTSAAAPQQKKVQLLAGLGGLLPFLVLTGPFLYISVAIVLLYSLGDLWDAVRRIL